MSLPQLFFGVPPGRPSSLPLPGLIHWPWVFYASSSGVCSFWFWTFREMDSGYFEVHGPGKLPWVQLPGWDFTRYFSSLLF